jgi:polyvinyl alcohol dehydrogenase (cytochrome)
MSFRFHLRVTALTVALLSLGVILATAPLRAEEAAPGEALYRSRCAFCHEGGVARAPDLSACASSRPDGSTLRLPSA